MNKLLGLLLVLLFLNCQGQKSKINGVSFVAAPQEITITAVDPVVKLNANWAAVMPYGFVKKTDSPEVIFNIERQWWGERREGAKKTIALLNAKKIQVMLKPQLWVWQGEFTGLIAMKSESDWIAFEKSYRKFIMLYAELAKKMDVPLLCIGTELEKFVQQRPKYWNQLIDDIKKVYKGELTYAENWDQYRNTAIWDKLDYIGVDAYFPVTDKQSPTISEFKEGWQKHKVNLQDFSDKHQKPILFTEYGYRSVHYTGKRPWDASRSENDINLEAQKNALAAIHHEFWQEDWFAGGFLWKWFHNHNEAGGNNNNRFTIQNKPAEDLIRQLYSSNK
ncbi:glycoside hydrolase family 113 [Aquimarina brevivitae]|uniref:Glycoside hydrolase n=1 Tax=Aquimarina brevivitae TaxID=323412 RepID=A0A4Q7PGW5_9FLAO|nr:glycoside hydrolase [Aquimarina brevivitae]RZS99766.1 hypothetical protein EV197_0992 [Aquimarina brevivitae]